MWCLRLRDSILAYSLLAYIVGLSWQPIPVLVQYECIGPHKIPDSLHKVRNEEVKTKYH